MFAWKRMELLEVKKGASTPADMICACCLYSGPVMYACPGGGNTWVEVHRGLAKGRGGAVFGLFCPPLMALCIHRSHVVTCAWVQQGPYSQSSFWQPVKPDSRKWLRGDKIWNVFTGEGRRCDCECGEWVWSSCDSAVWPCPLQVTHMSTELYLSHTNTQETTQAHVTFVCAAKLLSVWYRSCHQHTRRQAQSSSHSVLTRVSRGIKEALRAKQKSSTCFLKERKHKRRRRLFLRRSKVPERKCASNDSVDSPRVLLLLDITLQLH